MSFALIHNNIVIEISEYQFPVADMLLWVEVGENSVAVGDGYEGGSFTAAPQEDIEVVKERRKEEVNKLREQKILEGFLYEGSVFDIDDRARLNIIHQDVFLSNYDGEFGAFTWRIKDNTSYSFAGKDEFNSFAVAVAYYYDGLYRVAHIHKDSIDTFNDIESVLSYDITTGWS